MESTASVEQRLARLEMAIAELQKQVAAPSRSWLQQITGSFRDQPFEELLAYGQAIRQGDESLLEAIDES
jgi:hypothetical protein